MPCNFNCYIETKGVVKVIGSHMDWKSDDILEMVQDRTSLLQTTNRKWYMAYRISPFPMTLGDLQGHSRIGGLFEMRPFVQLYNNWQDLNWHSASRGPYASLATC